VRIFEETRAAMGGFDPSAIPADTLYEEWGDLVPPPTLAELAEELASKGSLDITREWFMASAELTLRHIAARDDTQTITRVEQEDAGG
jgi:hypothetical protein